MASFPAVSFLTAVALLGLSACHPTPGPDKTFTGAVLGAGWGAGAGAIVGHQVGHVGPGTAIGAGVGAVGGAITGMGLDISEGTELEQQRQIDALKVQVAANQRALVGVQESFDHRGRQVQGMESSTQIFFDPDRASLRAGSAEQLQRFAEAVKLNPYVSSIKLHGHTDDTGDTERNMRLSEARARTVAAFLANHGISLDRIEILPHGATRPLASNELESGRQLNRRVEIVLQN